MLWISNASISLCRIRVPVEKARTIHFRKLSPFSVSEVEHSGAEVPRITGCF